MSEDDEQQLECRSPSAVTQRLPLDEFDSSDLFRRAAESYGAPQCSVWRADTEESS